MLAVLGGRAAFADDSLIVGVLLASVLAVAAGSDLRDTVARDNGLEVVFFAQLVNLPVVDGVCVLADSRLGVAAEDAANDRGSL